MAGEILEAVIKLGGSVITDKGSDTLRVRRQTVQRLATEIGDAGLERVVLVHGAGSYGHRIVKRSGIDAGVVRPGGLLAWAETQRLQYVLASEVAEIFIQAGLPAVVCQASASAVMRGRGLEAMDVEVARRLLENGAIPQFFGVPAVDLEQGCAILSGDQIAPYLANALGIGLVLHGTDVDGVFESDPSAGSAPHVAHIHRGNQEEVLKRVGGSSTVDVTGGMRGKIEQLLTWARQGLRARVVDATMEGQVARALAGEPVGTLVSWEEEQ